MCRARRDALASQPRPLSNITGSATNSLNSTTISVAGERLTISTSSRSISSLTSLRPSLYDAPTLYSDTEISAAIINRLSKHLSSSSSRCSLRGRDVFVHRRSFLGDAETFPARLADVCKSHHRSLVRLLGASISDESILLVYDFAPGTSLSVCLRNPRNLAFTPLSSWISRMQVAADVAQGLDYIHHHAGGGGSVHNRIKSSAVMVSENGFNAKICHFGAAFLAGEVEMKKMMMRSASRSVKIEGTRGYLAPEVIAGGRVTRKSDVFAFGVLLLELISGDEPVKCLLGDGRENKSEWVSLMETAREVVGAGGWEAEESPAAEAVVEERRGRVRRWVDRRLKDSFPLEVAEKMMAVALRCVEGDAGKRPGMSWVQGKISQLFLESKVWSERIRVPVEISATTGPR